MVFPPTHMIARKSTAIMASTVRFKAADDRSLAEKRLDRDAEENISSFIVHGTQVRREQVEAHHTVRSRHLECTDSLLQDSLEEGILQWVPLSERLRFG